MHALNNEFLFCSQSVSFFLLLFFMNVARQPTLYQDVLSANALISQLVFNRSILTDKYVGNISGEAAAPSDESTTF